MTKVTLTLVTMAIVASLVLGGVVSTGCAGSSDQRVQELEAAVQELQDVREIQELRASYCYYTDTNDWQNISTLFTDDAVCDFGPFGFYDGKEAVIEFFRDLLPAGMSFTLHMTHNPKINVTGDAATGEWYYEVAANSIDNAASWIGGKYIEQYVKVDGGWKFKEIVADWYYSTPYEKGWAEEGMIHDPSP
jgi:outer membrane murein-binding lipoprotein Lpp